MHAYLITGDYKNFVKDKFSDYFVQKFPFTKISDARELTNFVRLKLTQKTAIVLNDFDKSSEESQNAFLKALEEPQGNLVYLLSVNNINSVLPTIVSRCQIVEIPNSNFQIPDNIKIQISEFINSPVGVRLKIISAINKREDAISFTDNLIISGHKMFLKKPEMVTFLDEANKLKTNLAANGNIQLQLTNFVVMIH